MKPKDIPYADPIQQERACESVLPIPPQVNPFKSFFELTGGSSLYCISAVLVAYGIVMVLRPVLEGSEKLLDAVPCLLTLHVYELALLGVLILVVFKKVVDDAISLAVLISLFMVGTSIALGSVADRNVTAAIYLGFAGIVIGGVKILAMRKFARIPFGVLSVVALIGLMAYNYLGPALMARSVAENPTDEAARRGFWLLLYLLMLAAGALIWIEAMLGKTDQSTQQKKPFLQSPVMGYLLAAILIGACGVHQYTMAYAFTLERVMLDYVPIVAVVCLLIIEILRYADKRVDLIEAGIACIPLAVTLYAIYHKSVLSSAVPGIGLICYPPVMLAGIGTSVAGLAFRRQCRVLWYSVFAYGLGIVLTFGFTPEYPHKLNLFACGAIAVTILLVYGFMRKNPYICLAGVIVLGMGMPLLEHFSTTVKNWQLTEVGCIAGIYGLGTMALCLLFVKRLHVAIRIFGAILLSSFVLDFLPASLHWRYAITFTMLIVLIIVLWLRTKDLVVIAILSLPILIKMYALTKQLAYWRYVIGGFLMLGAGAFVSLFKRSAKDETQ